MSERNNTLEKANRVQQDLRGKQVVFLGGTSGIGLAAARIVRDQGAEPILVGRNPEKLEAAKQELGTEHAASLDATDEQALEKFFADTGEIDHVFVTTGGPHYGPFAEMDFAEASRAVEQRISTMLYVARHAGSRMPVGGAIVFMGGTGSRRPTPGLSITGTMNDAAEALTRGLAVEIAPVRVNLIAAGFVDTQMSADIFEDEESLEARREELRQTLPIRRVVQPEDVALAAIQLMVNPAITGATIDFDGGQSLI